MANDYDEFVQRMTSFDMTLDPDGGEAQHDSLGVDDILAHYGVKGMKWGVRKDRKSSSGPGPIARRRAKLAENKAQKQADRALPASEDAVKAKEARRKARNASTDVLSNQELQHLVNRLNLEKRFAELTDPTKESGESFIKTYLDAELGAVKSGKLGPTASTIDTVMGVKKLLDKVP